MKKLDDQQLFDLMEVIEDRLGRTSTIIVSQLPISNRYDVLEKNATVTYSILGRAGNNITQNRSQKCLFRKLLLICADLRT